VRADLIEAQPARHRDEAGRRQPLAQRRVVRGRAREHEMIDAEDHVATE